MEKREPQYPNLQTVYRQPSPRFRSPVLEFRDDGVMHFLLLFPQELRTDGVESITSKFVLPLHKLQEIELKSPFHWCLFGVTLSVGLRREVSVFCLRFN